MKLERLHEYILPTVAIGGGMLFAVFVGHLTGGGDMSRIVMMFAGIVLLALVIKQSRNLWVLIPACWFLLGRVQMLPVPFSVRDLMVMLVFGMTLVLVAIKIIRVKPVYGWLEFLLALNLLYLATCFIRNPVGSKAFNSDLVGGKPYFDVFIGVLAYWVLVRMRVTPTASKFLPLLTVGFAVVTSILGLITYFFPATAPILWEYYSDVDSGNYRDPAALNQSESGGADRFMGFRDLGKFGSIALFSHFRPITTLIPEFPFRMLGLASLGVVLLLSGFRSYVMYAAAMFLLGSYFRGGLRGLFVPMISGAMVLIVLASGQGRLFELPLPMQRALSFLPGRWDNEAVMSGQGSSQWRFEMWKIVLTSDDFIRNKLLGDGFGFTLRELEFISVRRFGIQTDDMTREIAMIAGDYHSGPISSIKFVGVPGLILFYMLMIAMARKAAVLIGRAKNTPYFTFALFIGMPIIFEPFFFTFIFGGYNAALPTAIFGLGMLKLTESSLADYQAGTEPNRPKLPSREVTRTSQPIERLAPAHRA